MSAKEPADPIASKFIGRDLRERSLYAKGYSVATQEAIQNIQRFIQDYKEYLTQDDLRYCMICLVEIGQINGMAAKTANPIIEEIRATINNPE